MPELEVLLEGQLAARVRLELALEDLTGLDDVAAGLVEPLVGLELVARLEDQAGDVVRRRVGVDDRLRIGLLEELDRDRPLGRRLLEDGQVADVPRTVGGLAPDARTLGLRREPGAQAIALARRQR